MARHIDADKLSIYFDSLAEHAEMEGLNNMAHIYKRCKQLLDDTPTTDVVPKSENIVELPCKVGTKVAVITSKTSDDKNLYIFEDRIDHYRVFDGRAMMCFENHLAKPDYQWHNVFFGDSAKEEAEKVLAELKKKYAESENG